MNTLWLDLETYSEVPITHGTYKYAENSEVMLFLWAVNSDPVQVWDATAEPAIPYALNKVIQQAITYDEWRVVAHNAMFDRNVLRLGNLGLNIPIEKWLCTMVQAHEHALPGGLDELCSVMGVPQELSKIKEGRALIQLFCKPRPANSKLRRATRLTHPEKWKSFITYAVRDVEAMREVARRMPSWNYPSQAKEVALYHLDQKINDRGAHIDAHLAESAIEVFEREQRRLAAKAKALTGGAVEAASQRDKLLAHINAAFETPLADLRAASIDTLLKNSDVPDLLRELLVTRQYASQTSVTKYKRLLKMICADGALRGVLQHAGAGRTRRWAGRGFQSQNLLRLPKYLKLCYDMAAELIKLGDVDLVFEDVLEVCAALVRGTIIARPGKRLEVADLSNIEGRMLAWLADEEWKLKAFADFDSGSGHDLYVLGYANSFNVPVEVVLADEKAGGTMRLIGKVEELALGYGGALGAFKSMAALYGIFVSEAGEMPRDPSQYAIILHEAQIIDIVKKWRAANRRIVRLWYDMDSVMRYAIANPGHAYACGKFAIRCDRNWLRVKLPSGAFLCYAAPKIVDNEITYMGRNSYTKKWERLKTYGGKVIENATQAEARNFFAGNMQGIEAADYEILLHTHDEVISEVDDDDKTKSNKELCALLSATQEWAADLPVAAAGFSSYRYKKG